MRFPFSGPLDTLFRGDRSAWWKILGAGAATAALVVFSLLRSQRDAVLQGRPGLPLAGQTLWLVGGLSALGGCVLGLLLCIKDAVSRRMELGEDIHPLLRLYFASRFKSLASWIITGLVLAGVLSFNVTVIREHLT